MWLLWIEGEQEKCLMWIDIYIVDVYPFEYIINESMSWWDKGFVYTYTNKPIMLFC